MADTWRNDDAALSQPTSATPASLVYCTREEYIVMDMKLDAALIRREREKRAWSQEHLAEVTGLALRTIQRIESTGSASYDSASAIAAVFELPVAALRSDGAGAVVSTGGARKRLTWHCLITLVGCALVAAVFTPPNFRVTIPAAVTLWLGCELAIKTRRGIRQTDRS